MGKSKRTARQEEIINIDKRKCIGCTACAFTCARATGTSVLRSIAGVRKTVEPKKESFEASACIFCGQCTSTCPTSSINARNDINLVNEALTSGKYLIATATPAVRATLGEEFNLPIGTDTYGKISASARKLGFQRVFNSAFCADMISLEVGNELIKRVLSKEKLPVFTSCCPAWINYVEIFHPEIINYILPTKTPEQMMGTLIKTYFAESYNVLPNNIFVVAISTCTCAKYEASRTNMGRDGYKDIDVVLTIREYAELLRERGINITAIPDEKPDILMEEHTGAAALTGISGGTINSILRVVQKYLNGEKVKVDDIEFTQVNGYENVYEATVTIGTSQGKVAVLNGLKDMDKFISSSKWKEYILIEVMGCPGGCVNGGGTRKIKKKSNINEKLCIRCNTCILNCPTGAIYHKPNGSAASLPDKCVGCTLCSKICRAGAINMLYFDSANDKLLTEDYIKLRADVLKDIDKTSSIRISDENCTMQEIYRNYIGKPGEEKAKSLLYTEHQDKSSILEDEKIRNKRKS
ncbi:[Fe-Fe] hydrogenase large subunit C-terminal domain-containing protein [Clostridium paridis]|uniref:4Fe-4S binding protein n=1 Tax=Clostridium paridis TaxID=2803863 RepID=A0A937FC25_9CLOT|nr:[Fe-Fe] hydrogenase large subunit C-terminal domain-containing protein [Clostridium paridis]MBL4930349.1 4Fe-4S binding protein [Clostridium paridis]